MVEVPAGIRDESTEALNDLCDRLGNLDLSPLLVYLIDIVSPSALPHLMDQFHVLGMEGSRLANSDADRRSLIKGAFDAHRHKGTRYAIRRAIDSLGLHSTIQEWFEYGGAPYHFKVVLDVYSSEVSAENLSLLDAYIQEYKNVRSVLDPIEINLAVASPVPVIACGLQSSEIIAVYPG